MRLATGLRPSVPRVPGCLIRVRAARRRTPWPEVVPALALLATATPAFAQQIGPNVPATTGTPLQNEPQVAAFGNTLVAVWHRDRFFRFGGWGLSSDGGSTWTDGGAFQVGTPGFDGTWGQATVCVDQAGRFYAATVYSADWWGVAVYRGVPQGGTLSWEGPLFAIPPTLIPGYDLNRALDAVRLTCDPEHGYLYLSFTRNLAVADGQYQCTIQFVRSLDGGTTWSAPQVLSSGIASNGSRPAVGPDGELYVMWEDFAARQVVGRRSSDFGTSFGPAFVVGEIRDNLGTLPPNWLSPPRVNPAITPGHWTVASDFPSLAVDRSNGPYRGRIYATWTDYAEGVVSPQTGATYDLNPDDWYGSANPAEIGHNLVGESRSPDFVPGGDPDIYTFMGTPGTMIHITGRVTAFFPTPSSPIFPVYRVECGEDTLQLTTVSWNGYPFSASPGPPPTIYTLRSPGPYYLTTGSTSQISTVYEVFLREWTPLPGQAALDHRDIVLTWSDDGGATWVPKRRVGDAPPGYDETFPAVAVDEAGRVHLAWYDRRDDPDCGEFVNTYWAFSVDGGASFGASRRLSTQASSWRFHASDGGSNIGDHLGLTTEGGRVHVLWTDTRGADADIYAVRIDDVPTGIAVPRFVAEPGEGFVRIAWTVADATGIIGFRLHRAEGGSESFEILPAEHPTRGPGEYQAEDREVAHGVTYRYRLEVVRAGGSDWEGPVVVSVPRPQTRLAWQRASPNPFSRAVRLELAVPRAGEVWVRVHDLAGHEVATIHRGRMARGVQTMTWEGRDQAGRAVAAGVYLLRADLGGERATARVVHIR